MANFIIFAGMEEPATYAVRSGGQYQLASWLRSFGYTVKVIDFCFKISPNILEEIANKHIDDDTLAFGISTTFWNIDVVTHNGLTIGGIHCPKWVKYLKKTFQKTNPNIKWILGGSNAASPLLEDDDWIRIYQFAEDETLAMLDRLSNKIEVRPLFNIQNFTRKYHDSDAIQPYETLSIEISRGCIFKCKFCQFPLIGRKKGTNIRREEDIRTELLQNYEQFGTTKYYFSDDTFNESLDKVQMIYRISKSLPFELEYVAYIRIDLLASYPEMIDLLPESGLRSAFFGIETFQEQGAKAIGKGWNGKYAKDFLLELKEKWKDKTNWWMGMIVGLPGWNREEEEKDLQWLIDNDMSCWWHWALYINPINAENGVQFVSEFEKNYEKYGYEFTDDNFVNWVNGNLVHTELQQAAIEINDKSFKYKKVSGFRIGEFSTTLRCDMKDLVNVNEIDVPRETLLNNTKQFVNKYIECQLQEI
jgi:hypothetical protein